MAEALAATDMQSNPVPHLLSLPPEVRQVILSYAIDIPLPKPSRHQHDKHKRFRRTAVALFLANKQLQQDMAFVLKQRITCFNSWATRLEKWDLIHFQSGGRCWARPQLFTLHTELKNLCRALAYLGDDEPMKDLNYAKAAARQDLKLPDNRRTQ
ncbi:hypothetical protein NA57DRAFT_54223 [Rhizodiscina lignyota]|uniref:Uncharacterized protein n=1 Tax=Rhizodiscina lignyota TaxID=1504668 RepID=A0A9P4IIK7_9PEZI|nr:hypothetical protein NA57DRAFT_54223 [Rhizodiscina lignyota]